MPKAIQLTIKQKQFIRESNQVWNFKIGAVRSGKSYEDIAYEIINGIVERSGLAGLNVIMGVSKTTIERNVLQPMREIYTSALVGTINSQNICIIAGEPVYCIGAEKESQVAKIQGSSIKYCYGDEVAKWNQKVFEMLESRLDKSYSRFSGSANPEHPNHWLKAFLDKDNIPIYVQHYTIDDNPFLPKGYVERLKAEYQPVDSTLYRRLILGEWCLGEGRCYSALGNNPRSFIFNDITAIDNNKFVLGIDWGGNKSAHTLVMANIKRNFEGVQIISSEKIPAYGLDPTELNDKIEAFIMKVRKKFGYAKAIDCYCDSAEQTLINGLRKRCRLNSLGVVVNNSLKRPINDRISMITRMIGQGRLSWFTDAQTSFDAMSTCIYNPKVGHEDERLDDLTTDIDSVDATEYSIEPFFDRLLQVMERASQIIKPTILGLGGARI